MDDPPLRRNWRDYAGRFTVVFELSNYSDVIAARCGALPPEKIRKMQVSGIVDTTFTRLVLPAAVVHAAGLRETGEIGVRFADGRRDQRKVVADAQVRIGDRTGVFSSVVEPGRSDALIGAIVLEELDLLPDCTNQKLVPRDPHGLFAEIDEVVQCTVVR